VECHLQQPVSIFIGHRHLDICFGFGKVMMYRDGKGVWGSHMMHGFASYILNTPNPQRKGYRGEYGKTDKDYGKSVNPSENLLELCKPLDKRVEAVYDRTASIMTHVGFYEVQYVLRDKLDLSGAGAL